MLKTLRPIFGLLVRTQFKPTIVLATSTVLMLTWWYLGSQDFYLAHFAADPDPSGPCTAAAAAYRFISGLLLLGVVPAVIVKFVFAERLADYGVRLGNRRRTIRSFLIFAPAMILLAYLSSGNAALREVYPINRLAGSSPGAFAMHVATYMLFYLGWEFHFRGFLQIGLKDRFGPINALAVQVMASSLLHLGMPGTETFGAIFGGILWGVLAYRTRSLLSGMLQHALLGISVDYFICYL